MPIDGIKEFTLITNNFNAEYGRNGSAQVQILTKSGSNEFHGRVFEFFRNDKLNARDYFDRTGKAPCCVTTNMASWRGARLRATRRSGLEPMRGRKFEAWVEHELRPCPGQTK